MPSLLARTEVPGGTSSAWTATDGESNIVVGVSGGGHYQVEFHLGNASYPYAYPRSKPLDTVVIAKAAAVRVTADPGPSVFVEIFS
jgi:hypothetical protein